MKKQKKTPNTKLFLNKETVTILNNYQSSKIVGGETCTTTWKTLTIKLTFTKLSFGND